MGWGGGVLSSCRCPLTRVLRDLSFGDHLFAFGIHQLAVLVLLQTLEDGPGVCFRAEPLKNKGQFDHRGDPEIQVIREAGFCLEPSVTP